MENSKKLVNQRHLVPIFFLTSALFVLNGCAVHRQMVIANNKITSEGLFTIDQPADDWGIILKEKFSSGLHSATRRDIYFLRCPGPQIMIVSRAVYIPSLARTMKFAEHKDLSLFMEFASEYIEDYYQSMEHRPIRKVISSKHTQLGHSDTLETIIETNEKVNVCDKDKVSKETQMKTIQNKFVIIEGGDDAAFSGWGRDTPKMIVFWYASPAETFDSGVGEFDRMVQSFQFLANQ